MTFAKMLLPEFLHAYPFQPATGVWRAVEVATVVNRGIPNGLGLDVGCGDGLLTQIIETHLGGKRRWIGIDPDPAEVSLAKETGVYEKCIVTGAAKLPWDVPTFDFAFSNSVLEHIPDIPPVLAEISRVLKPGGKFICTVPSDSFHDALHGPLLPGIARSAYLNEVDRRCAHIHYWNEKKWRTILGENGLTLVAAIPYLDRTETRRWETCSRLTGGLLYKLFGSAKQPIEIQRRLGMRRRGLRMPLSLAKAGARLLSGALDRNSGGPYGCLLIEAIKEPS
jgi:SAM-dependent methyltransferase